MGEYDSYSFIYPSDGVDVTEFVNDEEAWEYHAADVEP